LAADKKNAARLGAHLVFADESGFLLIPYVAKTWSPQGCTPIHYHRQRRRDKVSVISGISVSPRRQRLGLYYQLYFDNIGQEEVCLFLRELLRHLRGQVIVVLDNSSTHKGSPLQQLLRQHSRLHIEHFHSYAPELNPDEGVWSLAKRALANSCPNDVEELVEDVIGSINAIRTSTRKLRGCILQSGLPSFFALEYCIIYAEINSKRDPTVSPPAMTRRLSAKNKLRNAVEMSCQPGQLCIRTIAGLVVGATVAPWVEQRRQSRRQRIGQKFGQCVIGPQYRQYGFLSGLSEMGVIISI
jgi:hypothetical protein